MLISAFLVLPKRELVLPMILIMLSIIIVLITSSSPVIFWAALREMRAVIAMVMLITLVAWIIGHRPYVKALMALGQKRITTPSRFFAFVAVLTHLISSFMGVGGIAFVYEMFANEKKASVSKTAWDFTLSTAIMRGFTVTVLWTTVHPAFAYVIAGTNAPLLPTMVKGLGMALIGLVIGVVIYRIQIKQKQISVDVEPDLSVQAGEQLNGLVGKFLFWVLLLMASILFMNQCLHIDILLTVPVVIVMITTVYFASNQSLPQYKELWLRFLTVDLGKRKKQLFVILSAGLLVGTLKETGYGNVLFNYFLTAVDWLNINVLIGLTLVVILMGFCGFPPIPAMVLLSGILGSVQVGYPSDIVAISLLLGVSVTLVVAPVTIPLLIISGLNGRSLTENGFRWNSMFGVLLLIVGLLYVQLMTLFN